MFKVQKLKSEIARRVECDAFGSFVKVCDVKSDSFCILPEPLTESYLTKIKTMKVYEDDVWVVSFPKTGTTWCQEMVKKSLNYKLKLDLQ